MSLTSELVFKAFEVGAATYATRAVAPLVDGPRPRTDAKEEHVRRSFFSRRTAGKPPPTQQPVSPVETLVQALMAPRLAPGDADTATAPDVQKMSGMVGGAIGTIADAARQDVWMRLFVCVLIDLVGSGSLVVPFLGDAMDIITAPVGALLLHAIFADPRVTAAGFAEELLPGTDVLPTATIAWVLQNGGYLRENGLKVDPQYVEAFATAFREGQKASASAKKTGAGTRKRRPKGRGTAKSRGRAWW